MPARMRISAVAALAALGALGCDEGGPPGDGIYDEEPGPHTTGELVVGERIELAEATPMPVLDWPPMSATWDGTGFTMVTAIDDARVSTGTRLAADASFAGARVVRAYQDGYVHAVACLSAERCAYLAYDNDARREDLLVDDGTLPPYQPLPATATAFGGLLGVLGDGYLVIAGSDPLSQRFDATGAALDVEPVWFGGEDGQVGAPRVLTCDALGCTVITTAALVRFHPDGTVDPPVAITGVGEVEAAACRADACLVVAAPDDTSEIRARLVDRDGAPLGAAFTIASVAGASHVAYAGADAIGFVVVTVREADDFAGVLHAYRIGAGGAVTASYDVMPTQGLPEDDDGSGGLWLDALVCGPPGCLMFASALVPGSQPWRRTTPVARLGASGVLGAPFEITADNPQYALHVVPGNDTLAMVWRSDVVGTDRIARWTPTGWAGPSVDAGAPFGAMAWNGTHYVAVGSTGVALLDATGQQTAAIDDDRLVGTQKIACHARCLAIGNEGTFLIDTDGTVIARRDDASTLDWSAVAAVSTTEADWFLVATGDPDDDDRALWLIRYDVDGHERGRVRFTDEQASAPQVIAVRHHAVVTWQTNAGTFARNVDAELDLGPVAAAPANWAWGGSAVIGDAVLAVSPDPDLDGLHVTALDHHLAPLGEAVALLGPAPVELFMPGLFPVAGAVDDVALAGASWLDPVHHVPRAVLVPLTIEP